MSTFTAQSSTQALYYVTTGGGSVTVTETIPFYDAWSPLYANRITESLVVPEANADHLHTVLSRQESLRLTDATGPGGILFLAATEALSMAGALTGKYGSPIREAMGAFSLWTPIRHTTGESSESVGFTDHLYTSYLELLKEICALTPTLTWRLGVQIVSRFLCKSSAHAGAKLEGAAADMLALRSAFILAFPVIAHESLNATDSTLRTALNLVGVLEDLRVQADPTSHAKLLGALADAAALLDKASGGLGAKAAETLGLTAAIHILHKALPMVRDLLTGTDTATPTRQIIIAISDKAVLIDPPSGETFTPTQLLNALVTEQINFSIGWIANDGIYEGYVVNTNTNAVSQYQGWNFNSFVEFYGKYLGASATQGLAQLGGSADGANPILATLQTAVTDFGSGHEKRVRSAYLGIAAEGTCYLQVLTDDNVERTYQLVPNAPGLGTERVDMARGVKSRYWSFSIQSVDGSAWRLDNLEVLPVVLQRRVR